MPWKKGAHHFARKKTNPQLPLNQNFILSSFNIENEIVNSYAGIECLKNERKKQNKTKEKHNISHGCAIEKWK